MKRILFILLFTLVVFVQVDFAQKKFIAYELNISKGLKGNVLTKQFVLKITPTSLTVSDSQGFLMHYRATSGTFGFGNFTKGYNTITNKSCSVFMDKNMVTIGESGITLLYKGSFYY